MTQDVVVLGLDGADREALRAGMNDGSLPTFARIAADGDIGLLRAPQPPLTPVSMASVLTGTVPEDHGVHCFEQDGGYVDHRSIGTPTLFETLDSEVIAVNVPMTSPPPDTGTVVVGFPQADRRLAADPGLDHRLRQMEYAVEPEDGDDLIDAVFDRCRQRFDITEELAAEQDWDLLFLMVTGDARLQHFSDDHATTKRFYELVDDRLGALLDGMDDPAVLVFSDHGFHDHQATLNIEQWLIDQGELVAEERGTDDRLYGRNSGQYDRENSSIIPMGAYMPPLELTDPDRADGLVEELLAITDPATGETVFRDIEIQDGGRRLVPVPRRGYSHRCWDGALFDHDPEERRVPDAEGLVMTDRSGLLPDRDMESTDVLPMIRELLSGDA